MALCIPWVVSNRKKEVKMPKVKNTLFQPFVVMLGGGKTLYLQSRQEAEVAKGDLDAPHLRGMIEKGHVVRVEEDRGGPDLPLRKETHKPPVSHKGGAK